MPTNFPTSVDNFTNPTANDSLNLPSHSTQHANANDAIEAVETSLLPAGVNYSGLIHINTTSFTAQTSVNIDNVFSNTFANYKIETKFTQNTANGTHFFKLRVGGADAAGNWRGGGTFNYATSATLTSYRMNGGTDFTMGGGASGSDLPAASFTLYNPFVAASTSVLATGLGQDGTASYSWNLNAYHDTATAFDGIKCLVTGGTITGTIRIYGIRN